MQPISVTIGGLPTADADAIAATQKPTEAGDLTLSATPYVLAPPRRITISSDADDSGVTFTVYGTTFGGVSVVEVLAGPNSGTITGKIDFATVTRIAISAASSGNITVGYAQEAGSSWVRMDSWAFAQSAVQVNVSGSITYSVQTTMDDPDSPIAPVAIKDVAWLDALDGNLVNETANKSGYFAYTPIFVRVLGSGGTGSATMTIAQFGNVPL